VLKLFEGAALRGCQTLTMFTNICYALRQEAGGFSHSLSLCCEPHKQLLYHVIGQVCACSHLANVVHSAVKASSNPLHQSPPDMLSVSLDFFGMF